MNVRQVVVMCFIDYDKAFDYVNWKKGRVRAHIVDLVESLYQFNSMKVRVDNEESEAFQEEQEVCQGCILSPQLFNIYGEHIIREALEHWTGGIFVGRRRISNLRCADDTTLKALYEEEMAKLVNVVKIASKKLGVCIFQ